MRPPPTVLLPTGEFVIGKEAEDTTGLAVDVEADGRLADRKVHHKVRIAVGWDTWRQTAALNTFHPRRRPRSMSSVYLK